MESQHSVGVPTYHDFPRFVFISEKSRPEVGSRWRCSRNSWPFWKKTPYWQIFINVFRKVSSSLRSMSCVQILWNLAERNSVKSCVIYLTKKKQNFCSRSRFCADRAQNQSGPAPGNMLGESQISSKSVHFQQSYSQTRECRWNAPKVFSILGEATVSLPSKYSYSNVVQ